MIVGTIFSTEITFHVFGSIKIKRTTSISCLLEQYLVKSVINTDHQSEISTKYQVNNKGVSQTGNQ